MDLVGQCMICGKPAFNTCAICGSLVCDEHFDPKTRMCSNCMFRREMADEKIRCEPRCEKRDLYR